MNCKYVIVNTKPDIAGKYSFIYDYQGSESVTVMDSFDYLMMNKGLCLLSKQGGGFLLFSDSGADEYGTLEDGELAEIIEKTVSPRVLENKHDIHISRFRASMLDELEKTVAKGEMYMLETGESRVYALQLEPLRGYGKETDKGLENLKEAYEAETLGAAVAELMKETGDEMLSYSSKPVLKLKADMPLHEVMSGIYSHLLGVMMKNTDGIIRDIDIEFLHDFRVSVRRTRSGLSLVRGVYKKSVEKEFRARFKELGSLTGLARDMDVYLDTVDEYEAMLPDWLKGGMDELADHFVKTREDEYKKLADYLGSGQFEKLCDDWTKVLNSKDIITKKGKNPVQGEAKKAIAAIFAEIEKQAGGMNKDTHSDAVHEIRISFKKIRYLMEFFSSLFDSEKTGRMLKDMKVLQDSLGDHNDYYVQQLMLEELVNSGKWNAKTSSACGFLAAILAEKQSAERVRALKLIKSFMEYKPLFGELLS